MSAIDTSALISNINSTQSSAAVTAAESSKNIGKEEFLTMLVAQLQNQDPMDPMSNEDFAVNLAQFSQLEQLISVNDNLKEIAKKSQGDTVSSVASYLGREVILNSNTCTVENCEGGSISFDLSDDAESVTVDLLNASGNKMTSVDLGELSAGHCCINLGHVGLANGEYQIQVTAKTAAGATLTPEAYAAGIVDGFIPGEIPTLLMNGKEIQLDNIKEVRLASNDVQ